MKYLVTVILISFFYKPVFADIIFDGYYKIFSQKKHIGFVIQSYEYNPKTKNFKSVYYIKTNAVKGGSSESLVATSNNKFQPISYQYTAQIGSKIKVVDAKFRKKGKQYHMQATVSDGKVSKAISKKLPKGSFLSTFLVYLMLQKGYDVNTKFNYIAVAEEDAEVYNGQTFIKEETTFAGSKVHKILNQFKGVKFISYATLTGEVTYSESPVQQISTQLVKQASQATVGFVLNTKIVKKLFGRVPLGNKNYLNKAIKKVEKPKISPKLNTVVKPPKTKAENSKE